MGDASRATPSCPARDAAHHSNREGETAMTRRSDASRRAAFPALLVVLAVGVPALAADATGTWTWTTQRGDTTFEQTLKLEQDGETLNGTISGRQGNEIAIEDGKVAGDTITFKVTREFNGNRFVMTYEGKLAGDTITGEVKFERNGEPQARPWEAKRAAETAPDAPSP
jgi:hypothetical protein